MQYIVVVWRPPLQGWLVQWWCSKLGGGTSACGYPLKVLWKQEQGVRCSTDELTTNLSPSKVLLWPKCQQSRRKEKVTFTLWARRLGWNKWRWRLWHITKEVKICLEWSQRSLSLQGPASCTPSGDWLSQQQNCLYDIPPKNGLFLYFYWVPWHGWGTNRELRSRAIQYCGSTGTTCYH